MTLLVVSKVKVKVERKPSCGKDHIQSDSKGGYLSPLPKSDGTSFQSSIIMSRMRKKDSLLICDKTKVFGNLTEESEFVVGKKCLGKHPAFEPTTVSI